jgi:hypothetical protein
MAGRRRRPFRATIGEELIAIRAEGKPEDAGRFAGRIRGGRRNTGGR